MVTKYQNPRNGRYLAEIQTVRLKQYDVEARLRASSMQRPGQIFGAARAESVALAA